MAFRVTNYMDAQNNGFVKSFQNMQASMPHLPQTPNMMGANGNIGVQEAAASPVSLGNIGGGTQGDAIQQAQQAAQADAQGANPLTAMTAPQGAAQGVPQLQGGQGSRIGNAQISNPMQGVQQALGLQGMSNLLKGNNVQK